MAKTFLRVRSQIDAELCGLVTRLPSETVQKIIRETFGRRFRRISQLDNSDAEKLIHLLKAEVVN